jgi:hypothetical protein
LYASVCHYTLVRTIVWWDREQDDAWLQNAAGSKSGQTMMRKQVTATIAPDGRVGLLSAE